MNKVGKIDPACRPPRSQRIPHKPGKVVVQMVVYLPSILAHKPVFAGTLKAGSEDTLSVFNTHPFAPMGMSPWEFFLA